MSKTTLMKLTHDERIAHMLFATVYPLYLAKVEKKGKTKAELDQVIDWLTGFDEPKILELIERRVSCCSQAGQ